MDATPVSLTSISQRPCLRPLLCHTGKASMILSLCGAGPKPPGQQKIMEKTSKRQRNHSLSILESLETIMPYLFLIHLYIFFNSFKFQRKGRKIAVTLAGPLWHWIQIVPLLLYLETLASEPGEMCSERKARADLWGPQRCRGLMIGMGPWES